MTCVAGLVHDGSVFVAGDSAGCSGWDLTVRADGKVWVRRPFVFGFTSSFRMGQLLRYRLDAPRRERGQTPEAFMVGPFVDAVRRTLKDGGWQRTEYNRDEGGTFIVGYEGRLFTVYDDYQVAEAGDGVSAIGAGFAYALGALHANAGRPPRDRLRSALTAAERFSASVRGPFTIKELRKEPSHG